MKHILLTDIQVTGRDLLQGLGAFDPASFNEVPFEGSWTAGQVADHLLRSAGVLQVLHGRTASAHRLPNEKVELIRHVFLDFKTKLKSPDFIVPSGGPHDQDDAVGRLREVWTGMESAVQRLDLEQLCLGFDLPVFGLMTRLEWITFYMLHTQRHIRQIRRIHHGLSIGRAVSQ